MVTIYDAVDVAALPAGGDAYLAYIDGGYVTWPAVRAKFPTATILSVTTSGLNAATICDVESEDATPEIAGEGVANGLYNTVYSALENKDAVFAACAGHNFSWFCAHPTGSPHIETDSVATQWAWPGLGSPGNYDISLSDGWPNVAPPPPPQPTEVPMPVSPVIFFASHYHELQVHSGVLWHKWWTFGQTGNGNENVVVVSGLPSNSVTFPDQYPQVAVANNQLCVGVEDSNGRAWSFAQSPAAPWGAKSLS